MRRRNPYYLESTAALLRSFLRDEMPEKKPARKRRRTDGKAPAAACAFAEIERHLLVIQANPTCMRSKPLS